ncbi:translation initiation factor IF-2 [Metallibacterium scheffleri]|jgi:translation initiation factor IF-2|uniref:Translation initiation factor IF-2 n=1 Tax=Metallibacterium scheffleri TaxID=993689 RepID=A0A4S3KGP5_9GAMM|nr:translation initiation factor IF-2 [Metallibacterium scheffleri]THD07817.1 translation initiation factor IF-2 [Metallibacterium scheffleri]
MAEVTIKHLATMLDIPADKLLAQLAEAGMHFKGPDQAVSSTEKMKLLGFLRRAHGKAEDASETITAPTHVTLSRRKVSEIKVSSGSGRAATSKTVAVEVRAKRTYVKRSVIADESAVDSEREDAIRKLRESQQERDQQQAQLVESDRRRAEEVERQHAEEEARKQAEIVAQMQAQQAAQDAVRASEGKAESPPAETTAATGEARAHPPRERAKTDKPARAPEAPHRHRIPDRGSHRAPASGDGDAGRFTGGGELHLTEAERARRAGRRKPGKSKPEAGRAVAGQHAFSKPTAPVVREVAIGDSIVVADLAQKLAVKGADVVKALFKMGVMATINQGIDHDTAVLVVEELGHQAVRATENDAETKLVAQAEAVGERVPRPPVVTIMGHVDHGKTSLLDYIRRTKVAAGEAGGITQHIGAYHVETGKGVVTFLDTPGHAAFTAMRARGARLTDIVVLVVAADDGVMPQTVEAVQHARAAKVPLIIAVNKMDKPDANPDNVKQGLVQHEVVPEEWGGDTQFVPVSAKTGEGVDALLDAISVQAEVMELRAVADGRASGVVVESSLDKGRGPVATVLVQSGLLTRGDYVVCGTQYGRVRALFDEAGLQVASAGPSIPVQMLGLSGVPEAGDDLAVVADERLAKDVAQQREQKRRETRLVRSGNRLEDLMAQMGQNEGQQQTLNIVVKTDVQGSVEALRDALGKIGNDQVKVNVIASGVGGITESDATLAAASKALLIGFNVRADASARKVVEANGLDLRYFSIIYDVIDQVTQAASGLLGNEVREEIIGVAQVRDVFRSSKFGAVAGCMVIEGSVRRNKPIRVLRDNTVVFQGELESLRRFKEAVEEVRSGMECGIAVKQYNDVRAGDQIECFERIEVKRTL